jgi:hypothetical protein
VVAVAAIAGLFAHAAAAVERPAMCKLVVKGKTYIGGQCLFSVEPDGSFQISSKDYFAQVSVRGKTAEASWNADPKSTHAQARLGTLTRQGACWVNATTEICARNLPPDKLAKAVAAEPKGDMISPDFPGASQSCVIAKGLHWAAGVPLVLDTCPRDKSAYRFVRAGGEIRIAGVPGLCVGLSVGAHRATLVLEKCSEATRQWTSAATGTTAALIRSNMDDCVAIPALANDKATFPFEIEAAACKAVKPKPVTFFFENN